MKFCKGCNKNKSKKSIIQFTLDGDYVKTWDSAHEIERELKLSNSNIRLNCILSNNNVGGYIFRYVSWILNGKF